ncbi:MAG: hypothetical protein WCX97_04315 [Candidatus Magasanikbacteria bacterium]
MKDKKLGIEFPKLTTCADDARRKIAELILMSPFETATISIIEAKGAGEILGNHFHTPESQRTEIFLVIGNKNEEIFRFSFRNQYQTKEVVLKGGEILIVHPGTTHAFKALRPGATLLVVANKEYNPKDDIKDVILT